METKIINNIAVVNSNKIIIKDVQSAIDFIMTIKYETNCNKIALNKDAIVEDFFILSKGLAGEILQKFINYQTKFAIYGDYSKYKSKPLRDFIYESNNGKDIFFVKNENEAIKMLSKIKIRLENENDYYEVENLTREAFWNVYRPGCMEHLVIHNLRKNKCFVRELEYVIELDDKIIANIVYAKGKLKLENGTIKDILLFGPVSVLPEYQKKGYGETLINYTMNKAKDLGYEAIVITGNPEYYKKYGFESCSKYNINYEGMSKTDEAPFFMIKVLDSSKINELRGEYSDPECYTRIDSQELEEFEKLFPKKIKEKREGQILKDINE